MNQMQNSDKDLVKRIEDLVKRIDETKEKTKKKADGVTLRQMEETAKKYAGFSPVTLAGIVGAGVGAAGGLSLGTALGVSLILSGPVGLGVGAALFAFAYKQKYNHETEVTTENFDVAYNGLNLKLQDPNISPIVKQAIEEQLVEIVKDYSRRIRGVEKVEKKFDTSQIEDAEIIEDNDIQNSSE